MAAEGMNTLSQRVDRLVPPTCAIPAVPRDIMIDIESLSLRPDALVLSIGACTFTCVGSDFPIIGEQLLLVPDMTQQIIAGRHIDQGTQKWWAEQPDAASAHWKTPIKTHPVRVALTELALFVRDAPRVWANGICFDITVLENLYQQNDIKVPWKYNIVRDARTFYDNNRPWKQFAREGVLVEHHPVDDCISQINRLWEAGFDR